MHKILIIDDDQELTDLLVEFLNPYDAIGCPRRPPGTCGRPQLTGISIVDLH